MYTKDIYLRALDRKDIEQNTLWINSEYVSDIMGYLPVMSITQQFEWWEKLKTDIKRYIFAICLKDGDKYIGNIGLGNINYVSRHAMISIFIADRSNHGKGMGSDAMRLIMVFAFERLNLINISEKCISLQEIFENWREFQQAAIDNNIDPNTLIRQSKRLADDENQFTDFNQNEMRVF